MSNPAFTAIYIPVVLFSAAAAYLYLRHVLWPAWRSGTLSVREHGITLGMVAAFSADSAENVYYGMGRISESFYNSLSWSVPHVAAMKLLILAASIYAISAYSQAVHDRGITWQLVGGALLLWGVSALIFSAL